MNKKRLWPHRLTRKVMRHIPLKESMSPSPLGIFSALNLLGSFIALQSGLIVLALVLATASAGAAACLCRQQSNLPG
jgi:hypothetical protein